MTPSPPATGDFLHDPEPAEEPPQRATTQPFGARRRRQVAAAALGLVLVVLGMAALAPALRATRIIEGPYVQAADPTRTIICWYTTRPRDCTFELTLDGHRTSFPVERRDRRHRVVLNGLAPGRPYPYIISRGRRTLGRWELQTPPAAGQELVFVVFGDSGRGTQAQYLLARQIERLGAHFVLHTGDLVYGGGQRSRYRRCFFEPYRATLARAPFWPCLGNHDVSEPHGGAPYLEVFELPENGPADLPPERNYWFDCGNARFVVIDSNLEAEALGRSVAPWVIQTLAGAGDRWRFVALHHPPYTGGKYAPDLRIQEKLVAAFEQAGVDVVFSGHDHMYQRLRPLRGGRVVEPGKGVTYIITGAGGAGLYEALPPEQRPGYVEVLDDQVFSLTCVRIAGDHLSAQQVDAGGRVIDAWELRRRRP